jgi:hypothetical protein
MSVWTALIVIAGMSSPMQLTVPQKGGPLNVTVTPNPIDNEKGNVGKPDVVKPPAITLGMTPTDGTGDKAYNIGSMTGIEADTLVNIPVVTTLIFNTQTMCDTAVDVLRKQFDVVSVACIETK